MTRSVQERFMTRDPPDDYNAMTKRDLIQWTEDLKKRFIVHVQSLYPTYGNMRIIDEMLGPSIKSRG